MHKALSNILTAYTFLAVDMLVSLYTLVQVVTNAQFKYWLNFPTRERLGEKEISKMAKPKLAAKPTQD